MTHFVSEIFAEPEQWGLRGDPFLWEYLKNYYAEIGLPYPAEDLKEDILRIFKDFAGEFPIREKRYFVKEFAKTHVGMSTGCLSADFWLDKASPCFPNDWKIKTILLHDRRFVLWTFWRRIRRGRAGRQRRRKSMALGDILPVLLLPYWFFS